MGRDEPLGLLHRLEAPHSSRSHPGRLMRLFSPIILILLSTVDRLRHKFTMCNITIPQFVCRDLPELTATASQDAFEESFGDCYITLCLQEYINDITVLIHGPPEIVLLADDLNGPVAEPDGIGNDVRRESVPFVGIHQPILSIMVT